MTYTYNGQTFTNYLGNYWDDYTGEDSKGDGIGDTPYTIKDTPYTPGDTSNLGPDDYDHYPLIDEISKYKIITKDLLPIINATVNCDPDVINLKSNEKWITCYIELEEGNVTEINGSTVYLDLDNIRVPAYIGKQGWAKSEATDGNIVDSDGDGLLERMVKFDMSNIDFKKAKHILYSDEIEAIICVRGQVAYNGYIFWFEGSDILKIINKKIENN